MKPIYTTVNAASARAALEALTEKWGAKYGAIIRLWNSAWEEFIRSWTTGRSQAVLYVNEEAGWKAW